MPHWLHVLLTNTAIRDVFARVMPAHRWHIVCEALHWSVPNVHPPPRSYTFYAAACAEEANARDMERYWAMAHDSMFNRVLVWNALVSGHKKTVRRALELTGWVENNVFVSSNENQEWLDCRARELTHNRAVRRHVERMCKRPWGVRQAPSITVRRDGR